MFSFLFYWWVFVLQFHYGGDWQCSGFRGGLPAVYYARHDSAHGRLFHFNQNHIGSRFRDSLLGFHYSVYVAHRDDVAHHQWCTHVGNFIVIKYPLCFFCFDHLVGRQNIPHRYFNVRQKNKLAGVGQVVVL